jgi:hypothetical protein
MTAPPVKLVVDEKFPPVAVQFTPAPSFVVAVTERPCVTVRPARFGEIETVIEPEMTVIVAEAVLVVSATDFAVRATVAGDGTAVGAVYVTEVVVTLERVPQVAPEHPAPLNAQVTPLF